VIDEPTQQLNGVPSQPALRGFGRDLMPRVLAGLVRRGEDFDAAEDALQEALLEALRVWPEHPPRDPRAWLTTVATRRLVDARRSEAARQRREETEYAEPRPAATEEGDDTLFLLFCCCHPDLAPASQVALTLRAVGGLTTQEIADAFYVPEATMAQRISRAKRTLRGRRLDQPGDLAVVLRVLYLVYTAGHSGPPARVDLAGEAIRLARQLTLATEEPEARGLLALMLLNHARMPARLDPEGRIVTLDRQDRGLWDTREIAEGVRVLQSALAIQTEQRRPGRYQVEAAIAALHDDAASAEETDWPQILAWYDDLVALTEDPVRQDPAATLGRAVAVGHVLGAAAGLRETDRLREVIGERHRWHAVRGHLHELDGDLTAAASAYAEAARRATNVAERDHLVRQAARARAAELTGRRPGQRYPDDRP
jgi:RNA polymerase sigma factor (sigma-70 family)